MKIAYRSRHGIGLAVIPQIVGARELKTWANGDERDVDDNLELPVKIAPDQPVRMAKAVDVMFMGGPDFVDAGTGVNPDFRCSVCGKETSTNTSRSTRTAAQFRCRTRSRASASVRRTTSSRSPSIARPGRGTASSSIARRTMRLVRNSISVRKQIRLPAR